MVAPDRGDVVWIDFDPVEGHEEGGERAALVLSPKAYNSKTGLSIVVPITKSDKNYPFNVPIPPNTVVYGVVMANQVRTIDWRARRARIAGRMPSAVTKDALLKLQTLLT